MACHKKISPIIYPLLNLLLTALVPALSVSAAELTPFIAHYQLSSLYINQGTARSELQITSENHYQFQSSIEPVKWIGIINHSSHLETSHGQIRKNMVIPEQYTYQHTDWLGNKRHVQVDFNPQHIINQHLHIKNKWKMERNGAELDRLSSQLMLMLRLQENTPTNADDATASWSYRIADGGQTKEYFFQYLQQDVIATPLGSLRTVKLKHWRSHQQGWMIIWCAEKLGYLPVKVLHKQPGLPDYISLIQSYQRLDKP